MTFLRINIQVRHAVCSLVYRAAFNQFCDLSNRNCSPWIANVFSVKYFSEGVTNLHPAK